MLKVTVNYDEGLSDGLKGLIRALDGEKVQSLNEVGARAANDAAIEHAREINQEGGWRGPNYLAGPARTPGSFGQNVALGWNFKSASKTGATISNNADFFAFKVTGGTITPKRTSHLTIPMVPEAAGRRVRDYQAATGKTLFRVLGKKALFEAKEGGGVRAVYALVKRVTQKPWPNALPDEEDLALAFVEAWQGGLANLIEDL